MSPADRSDFQRAQGIEGIGLGQFCLLLVGSGMMTSAAQIHSGDISSNDTADLRVQRRMGGRADVLSRQMPLCIGKPKPTFPL
jgi:hypothetical protein